MRSIIILCLTTAFLSACSEDTPQPIEPDPVNAAPLDTTSHIFTWEFDTVAAPLSAIHGIAAVGPDDIWVSGQFYWYDSTGRVSPVPVGNAAHWNGKEWKYKGFNSMGGRSWYPLDDAAAFGPNNVWICGGSPYKWDGAKWTLYNYDGFYFHSGINDIWASPDQKRVCAVGYDNSCVLYAPESDSFEWVNMPGEDHLYKVHGTEDGTIYIAAGNPNMGDGHVYTISTDGTVETMFRCPYGRVSNLWHYRDTLYITWNEHILRLVDAKTDNLLPVTKARHHIFDVIADAPNSIIATTDYNYILHFNGATWEEVHFAYPAMLTVMDASVCGRHVYIAAYAPGQVCVIAHGTRQ
ncbi:WD40 repeat domain-containing protein [bacterium]|nr:WD40 repeat domain-containing protein [bacterium]